MIYLNDVTLVCFETRRTALAMMNFEQAQVEIKFGKANFFDTSIVPDPPTKEDWERWFWYELPKYIETEFMLFIEWDAGIHNPKRWSSIFLEYDYIGAPWPWHKT